MGALYLGESGGRLLHARRDRAGGLVGRTASDGRAGAVIGRSAASVLALQRLAGNRAVAGLLSVSREEDRHSDEQASSGEHARPTVPKSKPVQDAKFERFRAAAGRYGLEYSESRHLWALGGGGGSDAVTGYVRRSDALELREIAQRHGTHSSAPSFAVRAGIRNLGGLNAARAHSGSDEVYRAITDIVERQLRALPVDVHGFRQGGAEFGFVLVSRQKSTGGAVRGEEIERRMRDAERLVKGFVANEHLDQIPHPKDPQNRSLAGTGLEYQVSDLDSDLQAEQRRAAQERAERPAPAQRRGGAERGGEQLGSVRPGGGAPAEGPAQQSFVGNAASRGAAFVAGARGLGLDFSAAAELYALTSGGETDALTGFTPGSDRMPTVSRATEYVRDHGVNAVYVEVDVRNLGGLNLAVGKLRADEAFARFARLAEERLSGLEATVCAFRHGGDEFSFVVVGRPGSPRPGLGDDVRARLGEADREGREAEPDLARIPHPKHEGRFGTGLVVGITAIGANSHPDVVVALADHEVEQRKLVPTA